MYLEVFFSVFHVYSVSIPASDCNFGYGNAVTEHC